MHMTNKKFNLGPFNIQVEKVEKPKHKELKPKPAVEKKTEPVEPVERIIYEKNWIDWLYENKIKVTAVLSSVFFVATIFGYTLSSYMIHSAYQEHIQHKIQTSLERK